MLLSDFALKLESARPQLFQFFHKQNVITYLKAITSLKKSWKITRRHKAISKILINAELLLITKFDVILLKDSVNIK